MNRSDIPFLSATELSGLIESKNVSPVEAVEAYLDRIDDLDFKFNAYLTVCRKEALQAAQQAEQEIARGDYKGPMHGIPVAAKDQMWSKGIRSTDGSRILADFIPDEDATAIANLKKAGAILLGKTNLTEFAMGGGAGRFSTPRNPWDLDLSAGASSGGSGAATAAFLCSTSLGEDTGGSIRYPACWCGVVGLRPSWGRVSRYGLMPGNWSMDIVGPISRTVEDAAITLGAIAGYDPKDPYTWATPVPDYRRSLDGNIKSIKVGVIAEDINSDLVAPEVRDAAVKAISMLGELGASVEEMSLPLTRYANVISAPWGAEPALDHREWVRTRLADYGHNNRIGFLLGSIMPAQAYYKAQKLRTLLRQQVLEALERYDVLVSPTVGIPAQPIADDPIVTSKEEGLPMPHILTCTFALASAPAISIPCGFTSQNLPIGLQIGGRPGGDGTILKVAHAYEQNTAWHTMKPTYA